MQALLFSSDNNNCNWITYSPAVKYRKVQVTHLVDNLFAVGLKWILLSDNMVDYKKRKEKMTKIRTESIKNFFLSSLKSRVANFRGPRGILVRTSKIRGVIESLPRKSRGEKSQGPQGTRDEKFLSPSLSKKNNKLELAVNIFYSFEQKIINFQLQAVVV